MTKVDRMLVAEGDQFAIECAVRSDLSSPVAEFLDGMKAGDPSVEQADGAFESDEQVEWFDWFLSACEGLANTGYLPHRDAHNQLHDGIWELKHSVLRVSFFDTDGNGNYSPKIDRVSYSSLSTRPWPEDFDYYLRLTTAFQKTGRNPPPDAIQLAKQVRTEDLTHDR